MEIDAKQFDVASLSILPNNANIDRAPLPNFVFMGKFEHIVPGCTVEDLRDENIKNFTKPSSVKESALYDLVATDKAFHGIRSPMEINDAENASHNTVPIYLTGYLESTTTSAKRRTRSKPRHFFSNASTPYSLRSRCKNASKWTKDWKTTSNCSSKNWHCPWGRINTWVSDLRNRCASQDGTSASHYERQCRGHRHGTVHLASKSVCPSQNTVASDRIGCLGAIIRQVYAWKTRSKRTGNSSSCHRAS